jgi:hypothetical protein
MSEVKILQRNIDPGSSVASRHASSVRSVDPNIRAVDRLPFEAFYHSAGKISNSGRLIMESR